MRITCGQGFEAEETVVEVGAFDDGVREQVKDAPYEEPVEGLARGFGEEVRGEELSDWEEGEDEGEGENGGEVESKGHVCGRHRRETVCPR